LLSCRKNTDVWIYMSWEKYTDVINVYVMFWNTSDMTYTFMTSAYFRNDIVIFFYFTWHLYLWQQCFSDMTATFMTRNVNFICIIHSHTKYQVNISKHSKTKVVTTVLFIVIFFYFTWHLHLWQQCFSDMTATFMTPVFFRHNSNIYDISVFSRHDIYIDDIGEYQVNISKHSKTKVVTTVLFRYYGIG
jgi:hypothetical protein